MNYWQFGNLMIAIAIVILIGLFYCARMVYIRHQRHKTAMEAVECNLFFFIQDNDRLPSAYRAHLDSIYEGICHACDMNPRTLRPVYNTPNKIAALEVELMMLKAEMKENSSTKKCCGICGGHMAMIRPRYPAIIGPGEKLSDKKRSVCPTCAVERLENIREISDKSYGQACQDGPTPEPKIVDPKP